MRNFIRSRMRKCCCRAVFCRKTPGEKVGSGRVAVFHCPELNEKYFFDFDGRAPKTLILKDEKKVEFESANFDRASNTFVGKITWPEPVDGAVETWFEIRFSSDGRKIETCQRKNFDASRRAVNARWRLNSVGYNFIEMAENVPVPNSPYRKDSLALEHHPMLNGIPRVLTLACEYIEKKMDSALGVYRAGGNAKCQTKLLNMLTSRTCDIDTIRKTLEDADPLTLANVIVTFCRRLPEPILSDESFDEFAVASSIDDDTGQVTAIRNVLEQLPLLNKKVMKHLVRHFHRVAKNAKVTKMDANNLALVFAPHLFTRPSSANYADAREIVQAAKKVQVKCHILYLLISRAEYILGDAPRQVLAPIENAFKAQHFQTLASMVQQK